MTRRYILTLMTGLGILFLSCNKNEYLNPIPSTSTLDKDAFSNPDRILNQVRGMYALVKSGNFLGGRYLIYNDVRGDNFINSTNNAVTALQTWNFTANNSAQEVTGSWGAGYSAINDINLFLEGMATVGTPVVGDALAANYIGEAKFLRALSYYELLQLYARPYWDGNGAKPGLPLRLTGNKAPGDYKLARATVAEVYTQILKDLNEAETAVPLTYSTALLNTTRAHRNTVIALKTRVYLSMQQYDKVITEANKIVNATAPFAAGTGVANALQSDITKVFANPFTTTESIFSLPFQTGADVPGTQNQVGFYYGFAVNGLPVAGANGEFYLNNSGVIADSSWKSQTDKRRSFIVLHPTNGRRYLIKFTAGTPFPDYVPVMRYAEVLLNLAEARARFTNSVDAQAVALLNAVRNRSDPATTYTVASFANVAALTAAILQERNIEFLGEGLRSPDLLRLGITIPAKGTVAAIPSTDSRYIWPISANELLYNSLMVDNK